MAGYNPKMENGTIQCLSKTVVYETVLNTPCVPACVRLRKFTQAIYASLPIKISSFPMWLRRYAIVRNPKEYLFYRQQEKENIQKIMEKYSIVNKRHTGLRLNSMACVALPTCGLAFAESESYLFLVFSFRFSVCHSLCIYRLLDIINIPSEFAVSHRGATSCYWIEVCSKRYYF